EEREQVLLHDRRDASVAVGAADLERRADRKDLFGNEGFLVPVRALDRQLAADREELAVDPPALPALFVANDVAGSKRDHALAQDVARHGTCGARRSRRLNRARLSAGERADRTARGGQPTCARGTSCAVAAALPARTGWPFVCTGAPCFPTGLP